MPNSQAIPGSSVPGEPSHIGPPRGSAEYLASRLVAEKGYSCPHEPKLEPGVKSKIPPRLGFFHITDIYISYIDTNKLCKYCYDDVVPQGFLCWSTYYSGTEANTYRPDFEYPWEAPTLVSTINECFPRQIQAGKEHFFKNPEPIPPAKDKAFKILGFEPFDPREFDKRVPFLPNNAVSLAAWRYIQWAKMPFYIDILHVSPPWRGDLPPKEQEKEDRRVAVANAAAYLGAAFIINAVPEGGYGKHTISEQRLGQVGTYRLVPLGQYQHHPCTGEGETFDLPEEMEDHPQGSGRLTIELSEAAEVDPRWYPGHGINKSRGDKFFFYPSKEEVDEVTTAAIGEPLQPTRDEELRRQAETELPPEPKLLLPQGYFTSPPPAEDISTERLPQMKDIPTVRWDGCDRSVWESMQGYGGVTVGEAPLFAPIPDPNRRIPAIVKPFSRTNSWPVRADGCLALDRNDYSSNAEPLLQPKCATGKCECKEGEDGILRHEYGYYVKRPVFKYSPMQPPTPPKTESEKESSDEILEMLGFGLRGLQLKNRRTTPTTVRLPQSWYTSQGLIPPPPLDPYAISESEDEDSDEDDAYDPEKQKRLEELYRKYGLICEDSDEEYTDSPTQKL